MRSGVGSKQKGSSFEREVCKSLSLWMTTGERKDIYWRAAMSGGRATVALRKGDKLGAQAGDISAVDPLGERLLRHVVVECKAYRDLEVASFLLAETGVLSRFWADLRRTSRRFGRHPMLVCRQNGRAAFVVLDDVLLARFDLGPDHVSASVHRKGAHLVLLDCFLREARVPGPDDLPVVPLRASL